MAKKFMVTGVIIDANDSPRRFELDVAVQSIDEIERKVRKVYRLTHRDLVRDISFKEVE